VIAIEEGNRTDGWVDRKGSSGRWGSSGEQAVVVGGAVVWQGQWWRHDCRDG